MLFQTEKTDVYLVDVAHAEQLHSYYLRNAVYFAPWEPLRTPDFHSISSWKERVTDYQRQNKEGTALRMIALERSAGEVIAQCSFTNISRGVFQACNLGYSIAEDHSGAGLMTEIVGAATDYVFRELSLHRVMANYMPENVGSARVLEKLEFEKEGVAKSYLKIQGRWRDHVLTSKISPATT